MMTSKPNPIKTAGLLSIVLLVALPRVSFAGDPQSLPKFNLPVSPMAGMTYIGKTVSDPNYFIWCASPLLEPDGKVHLFCSRWPKTPAKMKPWTTHSEIVHYVAENPEGPFHFADLAMACAPDANWNNSLHNPAIARVGDTYVLLYVTFDRITADKRLQKRWVCMATSKSPSGPWRKMGETGEFAGRIIAPATDPAHWTFGATRGFDNPAFLAFGGRYYIYFKTMSANKQDTRYGYAVADQPEGPYVLGDQPCTDNTAYIEDATAFVWDHKVNLLVTDNFGKHTGVPGAGMLWQSDTPTQFKLADAKVGFMLPDHYWPTPVDPKRMSHPKGSFKFERPGVLLQDGRPAYFYATPGDSPEGDETTSSYVFKINLPSRNSSILTSAGWTIEARGDLGQLTIKHERLGTILSGVQLNLETGRALREMKQWTAEICGPQSSPSSSSASKPEPWTPESGIPGRLLVRTAEPSSTWIFEPTRDELRISSTAPGAVLTGQAPASKARGLARLSDPDGAPVTWRGTGECAGTYGGKLTQNQSYLPQENPECMYFTLGQASGSLFHNLFDQKTDTAIRFTPQTRFSTGGSGVEQLEFTMPLPGPGRIRLVPDYYIKVLGLPYYAPLDTSVFDRAPTTWCSWASYFGDVTEDAIVRNTDWLAKHLQPYGFQYVQIDDGYDRIQGKWGKTGHNWIDQWDKDKFPKGPEWIAKYIKAQGLRPGLWLVPNAYSGAVETHPDWYLRDKEGGLVRDYNTPSLDSSNPEVLGFLKKLFSTLGGWGFEYYKFDGEFALPAYAPKVDVTRLHDSKTDPVEIFRKRLAVIREAIGPKTFVEGCPSGTPLDGIGYYNSYFNGQDVYNNWQGMHSLFDSINSNAFLNRMVVYVMPDGVELGEHMSIEDAKRKRPPNVAINASQREEPITGLGVTLPQARTLVSVLSLSGVAYSLTGVMPELPPERLPLLQRTLPTMPIAPLDLFSRGSDADWAQFRHVRADDYIHHYPEVLDLKVAAPSGTYDVVALPNWRSAPVTKDLSLVRQLGLDPGGKYIVFDFWNQTLLGVFSDRIPVEIDGCDTRVLLVHRLLDRPQLVGTSRHITGAYSIENLSWDAAANTLQGLSEVVPGADYTLHVHLPPGTQATPTPTALARGRPIPVRQLRTGDLLSVTFKSQDSPVVWKIRF